MYHQASSLDLQFVSSWKDSPFSPPSLASTFRASRRRRTHCGTGRLIWDPDIGEVWVRRKKFEIVWVWRFGIWIPQTAQKQFQSNSMSTMCPNNHLTSQYTLLPQKSLIAVAQEITLLWACDPYIFPCRVPRSFLHKLKSGASKRWNRANVGQRSMPFQ